jgi:hypothetical protein
MLKKELKRLVIEEDAFGLGRERPVWLFDHHHHVVRNAEEFRFFSNDRKLEEMKKWLQYKVGQLFLKNSMEDSAQSWLGNYINQAYQRGLQKSYNSYRRPTQTIRMSKEAGAAYQQGGMAEFMRQSFGGPTPMERVRVLATRTYNDLGGLTEQMNTTLSRTLLDGIVNGLSPRKIGEQLGSVVDGYSSRSTTIARTEIVRAFNEGALDGYENLGAKALGVAVEWTTSGMGVTRLGNPSPCKKCAPLAGLVLSIEEARGLLPRHPNCMCTLIPANVGEKSVGQIRDAKRIRGAIERSASGDKRWIGASKTISRVRPTSE